ncbi:hypothetical protein [Alienimonas sp. DA493]|uniref:hypothetical protein n=1 Tax=Alienimonas sp. DA493 TaxID=3373605 RepID=UPI0037547352
MSADPAPPDRLPKWPRPTQLADLMLGTPPGAAYEAGRLTIRLRAFAGLDPLLHGVGVLGEPEIGRRDVDEAPAAADLGVGPGLRAPHLWFRRCCEAALDGDRLVAAGRVLERLEDDDFLTVREQDHGSWHEAFYPRDEEETYWAELGWNPRPPGESPPAVDPLWDRGEASHDALRALIGKHVEPADAFAQDLRRVFADGPADVAAAFELGRSAAELELPPKAYRVVLRTARCGRWPLDREALDAVKADPDKIRGALSLRRDLPPRLQAAAAAALNEFVARVRDYRERRRHWRMWRATVDRDESGSPRSFYGRDAFREAFVPLPAQSFAEPGPWEIRPEPAVLREAEDLAVRAGLPADEVPEPPALPPPTGSDPGGWLDGAGQALLQTFGEEVEAVARQRWGSAAPSPPPLVKGPFGITYDPSAGVVRWRERTVVIPETKLQARLLFRRLCEHGGHLTADVINANPGRCGFTVGGGRIGEDAVPIRKGLRVLPNTVAAAASRLDAVLAGLADGAGRVVRARSHEGEVRLTEESLGNAAG